MITARSLAFNTAIVVFGLTILLAAAQGLAFVCITSDEGKLASALVANGVALVPIKPYTTALIAALTFVPMTEAVAYL